MSHITKTKCVINDLDSLKRACRAMGLEWKEGQKSFKWYGRFVGDYNSTIPQGEMGKCDHAIAVPGKSDAYEVGVVKSKHGPGYELHYDFWSGGFGLMEAVGDNASKLVQEYGFQLLKKQAGPKFRVNKKRLKNGTLRTTLVQVV